MCSSLFDFTVSISHYKPQLLTFKVSANKKHSISDFVTTSWSSKLVSQIMEWHIRGEDATSGLQTAIMEGLLLLVLSGILLTLEAMVQVICCIRLVGTNGYETVQSRKFVGFQDLCLASWSFSLGQWAFRTVCCSCMSSVGCRNCSSGCRWMFLGC